MSTKTIILNSGRCAWGACFACGWGKIKGPEPSIHRLKAEIDKIFSKLDKGIDNLKIFASGSFLDDRQFPRAIRQYLVKRCIEKRITGLTIESRPEFITDENLQDFKGMSLTVAIGLEIADNEILKKYNKGFTVEDYIKAAEIIKRNHCKLRTYIMVGLPFVKNHKQATKDSVELARKYSDSIVLINTFPHSAAPIFDYWLEGKWKPLDRKQFEDIVRNFPDCEKEFDNFAFIPKFPREKREFIKGATKNQLLHPHFEVWQDYFCRFYQPPQGKNILLFIPCTHRKPYYKSQLHKAILSAIEKLACFQKIHMIVVSNPGVIPYEFADNYPFANYDWPEWEETPEIKKLYIDITAKRVLAFLSAHKEHYKAFFAYFKPDSESWKALQKAAEKLDIKIKNCVSEETYKKIKGETNPLTKTVALEDLSMTLKKL